MKTPVNISEAVTLAMHSLVLIANNRQGLNAKRIAMITKTSRNHLSKVLSILVRHRYLASKRGPDGGFLMVVNPRQVTLLEIYKLIEGEMRSFECNVSCKDCYINICLFGNQPGKFTSGLRAYLENKKLSDFTLKNKI